MSEGQDSIEQQLDRARLARERAPSLFADPTSAPEFSAEQAVQARNVEAMRQLGRAEALTALPLVPSRSPSAVVGLGSRPSVPPQFRSAPSEEAFRSVGAAGQRPPTGYRALPPTRALESTSPLARLQEKDSLIAGWITGSNRSVESEAVVTRSYFDTGNKLARLMRADLRAYRAGLESRAAAYEMYLQGRLPDLAASRNLPDFKTAHEWVRNPQSALSGVYRNLVNEVNVRVVKRGGRQWVETPDGRLIPFRYQPDVSDPRLKSMLASVVVDGIAWLDSNQPRVSHIAELLGPRWDEVLQRVSGTESHFKRNIYIPGFSSQDKIPKVRDVSRAVITPVELGLFKNNFGPNAEIYLPPGARVPPAEPALPQGVEQKALPPGPEEESQ